VGCRYAHLAIISNLVDTARVADAEITRDGPVRVVAAGGPDTAARLRAAGVAPTRPRQRVLEALDGRAVPVSATDIHGAPRAAGARIGLTTVYRILHVLADNGLVHVLPGDEQRYRICASAPHTHLVCTSCGLVLEEPTDTARRWLQARADFEVDVEQRPSMGCVVPAATPRAIASGHSYRKRIWFPHSLTEDPSWEA